MDPAARNRLHEQRERFAGAMLGLALALDSNFLHHFLEAVCGLGKTASDPEWSILIEPENWCDLGLINYPKSLLVVVELKIGSHLSAHQDPSSSSFDAPGKDGFPDGYALGIREYGARHGLNDLRYYTLEKEASWSKPSKVRSGLHCSSAEWRRLLRPPSEVESTIERAIYDCLGSFGISLFSARRMTIMKLGTDATKVLALLAAVFETQGPEFKPKYLEASTGSIGIRIPASRFPNLTKRVEPEGDWVGWFGYESEPARLSFWFYCYRSDGSKPESSERIKNLLLNSGLKPERVVLEPETRNVRVDCPADKSTGDLEWFNSIFRLFPAD